jgi:phosphatidylethanolamine/phosphatidyl-N-methylethanolamine N-methyltransferase
MGVQYDLDGQRRIYARWAPIYDAIYHRMLSDAHRRTATAAAAAGPDILEVGVGTGLVLPYYPKHARVVGVDLSEHMLRKAVDKVRTRGLSHVQLIASMDACRLGFPDARFDAVAVPFVITLVPDPEQALDECARVLKPGGEIVVASKLGDDRGIQAKAEELIAPLMKQVGWSSAFKASRIATWAGRHGGMEVVEIAPLFPAGLFKLMRVRKTR